MMARAVVRLEMAAVAATVAVVTRAVTSTAAVTRLLPSSSPPLPLLLSRLLRARLLPARGPRRYHHLYYRLLEYWFNRFACGYRVRADSLAYRLCLGFPALRHQLLRYQWCHGALL